MVKARTWQQLLMLSAVSWLPTTLSAQKPSAPEPALPEPEWREAESISLFPARGAVPPASLADDSRRLPGMSIPSGVPPSAPAGSKASSIPGIPELDFVPGSVPGGDPGAAAFKIPAIDSVIAASGFGIDPFSQLPELPDDMELPDQIKEMEENGGGRVVWHVNPRKARKIAAKEGKVFHPGISRTRVEQPERRPRGGSVCYRGIQSIRRG